MARVGWQGRQRGSVGRAGGAHRRWTRSRWSSTVRAAGAVSALSREAGAVKAKALNHGTGEGACDWPGPTPAAAVAARLSPLALRVARVVGGALRAP